MHFPHWSPPGPPDRREAKASGGSAGPRPGGSTPIGTVGADARHHHSRSSSGMSGTTPSSAATVGYTPEGRPRSLHDAFGLVASPVPTEPGSGDPAVFSQGTAKGSFGPLGARSSPGAPGGSRERRMAQGPAGYLTRGHVVELPTAGAGSAGSNLGMIPELPGDSSKGGICHAVDFSALDVWREEAQMLQGLLPPTT